MVLIRNIPGCTVYCTVGNRTRRSLYLLKDVENGPTVQVEDSAKFGLPPQKVSCPLGFELLDSFNDSMEIFSVGVVHGNACSHSVMTTSQVCSYWFFENTPRLKKIYSTCDLLTRTLYTVYPTPLCRLLPTDITRAVCAVAGVGSGCQILHGPSMLRLVQAPIDEYYTTGRLGCGWCRLRLTNTTHAVCPAAGAGSD